MWITLEEIYCSVSCFADTALFQTLLLLRQEFNSWGKLKDDGGLREKNRYEGWFYDTNLLSLCGHLDITVKARARGWARVYLSNFKPGLHVPRPLSSLLLTGREEGSGNEIGETCNSSFWRSLSAVLNNKVRLQRTLTVLENIVE